MKPLADGDGVVRTRAGRAHLINCPFGTLQLED